jgi:hypothetical protein
MAIRRDRSAASRIWSKTGSVETTAIVAELLVIGIEALVWVFLLASAIVGYHDVTAIAEKWPQWAAGALIPFAYALGIIVDRVADLAVKPLLKAYPDIDAQRLQVLTLDNGVTKFVEYIRSRFRIARATAFNFALITLFGGVVVLRAAWTPCQKAALILAGAILSAVALGAAISIHGTYGKWLENVGKTSSPVKAS